ncbi:hypothetical protein GM921_05180 [Pedobacter sp. LMG 31464]|uniref:Ig-like domain-containing protein n=1 Tax=Pedobacter planticolens TaxID=2679964 RepID=A0A923DZK6_9SPHI|nr:hypothetical protein [Pedobacter planticolens]MBB2144864.1 hypothetical protein [Pedobacter planticolens]
MKTTIIKASLAVFILILSVVSKSKAQTYYPVYLCSGGTATLHTPEEIGLVSGDKVHWYLEGTEITGSVRTYDGTTANSTNYVTPNNLTPGVHNYTSRIESVAGCWGDMSDPFQVYQLPDKTLALTANNASYCGDNATLNSVITATTTPGQALPDGIEYAYVWTATKNGSPVSPLTSIGSDNASSTAVNLFTLTTTGAGSYVFSATVKYVIAAANTSGVLKSGDNNGCIVSATATQTVTVTPKPAKPTIIVQ